MSKQWPIEKVVSIVRGVVRDDWICNDDAIAAHEGELRSVFLNGFTIGYGIHQAVIAEGKREGVWANLDHELIGSGKLPFVKFDERTKETHRRFSKELAERIRTHRDELRVYFAYVKECDRV